MNFFKQTVLALARAMVARQPAALPILPHMRSERYHLEQLRRARTEAARATIPAKTPRWLREQFCEPYIACAVGQLGQLPLARVVWPWANRQPRVKAEKALISRARRKMLRTMRENGMRVARGRVRAT